MNQQRLSIGDILVKENINVIMIIVSLVSTVACKTFVCKILISSNKSFKIIAYHKILLLYSFNTHEILMLNLCFTIKILAIPAMEDYAVLEITVGHWLFSDQFQHLANQNPFWLAKFAVHFQWGQ